ncbi:MAG: hypothetical protein KAS85_06820 [Rhodobacteraceae bacterium]|nr:hypothetical protein [Paracoccaceae bacterium]
MPTCRSSPKPPPPGLVTVPAVKDAPEGYYAHAGYRLAGDRAIRIDMLERLADMIRSQDTRSGFEANPDMLSITGLTLEQFANLMEGLGYKAEKGERPKVKVVVPTPEADKAAEPTGDAEAPAEATEEVPAVEVEVTAEPTEADAEPAEPEVEVFYTFTWAPRRRPSAPRNENRGKGKPKGKPRGKGKPDNRQKNSAARPPKQEKPIDPDNPFAALMALKGK